MIAYLSASRPGTTAHSISAKSAKHDVFTVDVKVGACGTLHLDKAAARKLHAELAKVLEAA